jgi:hypothetical protein
MNKQTITELLKQLSEKATLYKRYNRKCKSCRGPLFERIVGTGSLYEVRVLVTEVFCKNDCTLLFTPTEREQRIMDKVQGVRYATAS